MFLISIIGILIFLGTSKFQNLALKTVNNKIPGHISIDDMDIDIVAGNFHITNIKIKDPDSKIICDKANLEFKISWSQLFKRLQHRELNLFTIEINRANLNLEVSEKGTLNLISALVLPEQKQVTTPEKKFNAKSFPFNLKINQCAIVDADINFIKSDQNISASLSDVDIIINNFDLFKLSAEFESNINKGLVKQEKNSIAVSSFSAKAGYSKNRISDLLVKAGFNDFDFSLAIKGDPGNPDAELKIIHGPGNFFGQTINKILLDCSLQNRVLTILPSVINAAPGRLSMNGKINLLKAFPGGFIDKAFNLKKLSYNLNIRQDRTQLAQLSQIAQSSLLKNTLDAKNSLVEKKSDNIPEPIPVKGLVELEALLKGTISNPEIKLDAKIYDLDFNNINFGDIDLKAHLDQTGQATIDYLLLKQNEAHFKIHGIVDLYDTKILPDTNSIVVPVIHKTPYMDLRFTGKAPNLANFTEDIKGSLSLDGNIAGTTKKITGKLDIEGNTFEIQGQTIDHFAATALIKDQAIDINKINIRVKPGSEIVASGMIDPLKRAFNINIQSEKFDLACINTIKKNAIKNENINKMLLSLDMKFFGKIDNQNQITASTDIANLDINLNDQPFINFKNANASFNNKILKLSNFDIDFLKGGKLNLQGHGVFDNSFDSNLDNEQENEQNNKLDFKISGQIPFELVSSYVDQIQSATGSINIAASLKGNIKEPIINAELDFKNLDMILEPVNQKFGNLSGQIQLSPEKINIDSFTGNLDQGSFDLGGSAELKNGMPNNFNLKLKTHNLFIQIPDTMDLTFNTDLNFTGTMDESNLDGEIVLLGGNYYKDIKIDLIDTAFVKKRQVALVKEEKINSWLKDILLDIRIKQHQPLIVDNNLAHLVLKPDMTILGSVGKPVVTGRAMIDTGTVYFQKAEFEVTKGVVDFTNPHKIQPDIDIAAQTEIRDWTILLTILGTLDNLDFNLSSDPFNPHADILSLIVFGKTRTEMQNASSGDMGARLENMAAKIVAKELENTMQDATGLDKLEIKLDEQDIHVKVGTNLSKQMSVSYDTYIKDGETIQRITTDYKILENLLMSGFQETGGNFGGKLKYRLEFR